MVFQNETIVHLFLKQIRTRIKKGLLLVVVLSLALIFQNCSDSGELVVDEFSSLTEVQDIKSEINDRVNREVRSSSGGDITRANLSCGINDVDPRDVADIDFDSLIENRMGAAAKSWSSNRSKAIKTFKLCSSLENSPYNLKTAITTDYGAPVWIVSDVDRVIHLTETLWIRRSHRVIDGRGANITIKDYGLQIKEVTDIIIHNIGIKYMKYPYSLCVDDLQDPSTCCVAGGDPDNDWPDGQDGINVRNADRVWIDHVVILGVPDEAISVTALQSPTGKNRTTISHSKILNRRNPVCADGLSEGHGIIIGCALSDNPNDNCLNTEVSVIRNYFEVDNRTPYIWGGAKAHAVNNRVEKPSDWFAGAKQAGRLYSGANWYNAATDTHPPKNI